MDTEKTAQKSASTFSLSLLQKEFIWISSNDMDETGAHYTEWSKPER